ncbi:MAG TPA: AAA family ATPase [Methylomirabilota bacterium]|nr:AAA family ATPase [Methylomirabilota bacterium]
MAETVTEAIDWLVHGLLPLGTLALLAAYPKVGKSTLATQLAVAVVQGQPFLGRPTRQGGVLYVVAEERKDDVIRRLRDFGWTDADPIWLWEEQVADSR